jgi:hypothetical protein
VIAHPVGQTSGFHGFATLRTQARGGLTHGGSPDEFSP